MCLGLHHNLNRSTVISPVARQHRIRLWWTIYICDRMWGSKLGQAPCVRDDDITVDLPSMVGLNGDDAKEFPDPDYILARISLAKITGNIIRNIYSRGKPPPFVQSVNQVLRDLNLWMATLPDSVRLGVGRRSPERPILSLHLSFNQVCSLPSLVRTKLTFCSLSSLPLDQCYSMYLNKSESDHPPQTTTLPRTSQQSHQH